MRTVLGLSVTANGVGWVLVDATVPTGRPIDDDRFTVRRPEDLVPRCLAAVRGAAGIGAAAGYRLGAVGVCWSADLEARSSDLLVALRDAGWADVRPVRQIRPPVSDLDERVGADAAAESIAQVTTELLGAAVDTDTADCADCAGRISDCDPEVMQAPAYQAAHLVLTNAVPTQTGAEQPVRGTRLRAQLGGRLLSLAGAAAVTAVIALFAVGSQFGGSQVPESATLANRATVSTPQTSPILPVQPMAAPAAVVPSVPSVAPVPAPVASVVVDTMPSTDWAPPAVEYAVPAPTAVMPEPVSHLGDPAGVDGVPVAAPGPEPAVPEPDASTFVMPAAPVPSGVPVPAPGALPGPAPVDTVAQQPLVAEPVPPMAPPPPAQTQPAPAQSVDPILGALP